MRTHNKFCTALFVAVLVSVVTPNVGDIIVHANADLTISNPCTSSWTGPSSNNRYQCDVDLEGWLTDSMTVIVLALLPFVLGSCILFPCCCCILIARYCCKCCGSAEMRPGYCCCGGSELDMRSEGDKIRMYSKEGIIFTKVMACAVALMGIVSVILCIVGGTKLASGFNDVPNALVSLADWAIDLVQQVENGIRDPSTNQYPASFDGSVFSSIINRVQDIRGDILGDYVNPYKDPVRTGTLIPAFITILPAVILLLLPLAAFCNIRTGLPLFVVMTSFPLQFVYFTVATFLLILLLPIDLVCNDLNAGPGVRSMIQWQLLPQCEARLPFDDIIENINDMEETSAVDGCEFLLEFCSPSTTYSSSQPQIKFVCSGLTNPSSQCTTLSALQSYADALYLKNGADETCGGQPSSCNLQQCSTSCDDSTVRQSAADAVSALNAAIRVRNTYTSLVLPWMSCQRLFEKLRSSGPSQACDSLQGGLGAFKNGAIVMAVALVVGILISFLGQKRFVNQDAHKLFADTDSYDPLAQPMQIISPVSPVMGIQTQGVVLLPQPTQYSHYVTSSGAPQHQQEQYQSHPYQNGQPSKKEEPPLVSPLNNASAGGAREVAGDDLHIVDEDTPSFNFPAKDAHVDDNAYKYVPIEVPKKELTSDNSDF